MTRRRSILGVAIVTVIAAPGLVFLLMRAGVQAPLLKNGQVHPVLHIARARFGGTVREVLAKSGDHVEQGHVLLRFESQELQTRLSQLRKVSQSAEAAAKGGNAVARIPPQIRQYMFEMHPDTLKAETEYVDALAAMEKAQGAARELANRRLLQATEERQQVRRRLGKLFAGSANAGDSQEYLAAIQKNIAEVEKLLQDAEVRSPASAVIDLLDAHPGEKIFPLQPVAILVSTGEYSVDLIISKAESERLHAGMLLKGRLQGTNRRLEARIESVQMHKLPVIARENLQTAEQPIVRLHIASAEPLRAGSIAGFELP